MLKLSNPILQASNLVKVFGAGDAQVRAVDGVSLEVARGELVVIMGPSGSGKTTLVSMCGALLRSTAGQVIIDSVDITKLNEAQLSELRALKIGFVFQAFNLLEVLSVEDNVLFPARLAPGGMRAARQRADALLERLNLTHRRSALPATLSGGEKQRVSIARALINQPQLIFADEPTGNLDSRRGQEVLMILHDVARDQGCAVVLVSHDPHAQEVADRILWLEDGVIRDRKSEKHSWVKDPVCGMRIDEWAEAPFTEYLGKRYLFCSDRCLERFQVEPDRYAEVPL